MEPWNDQSMPVTTRGLRLPFRGRLGDEFPIGRFAPAASLIMKALLLAGASILAFSGAAEATTVTFDYTGAAVPEPSAWSLMLSGFGFLGYVPRQRLARVG